MFSLFEKKTSCQPPTPTGKTAPPSVEPAKCPSNVGSDKLREASKDDPLTKIPPTKKHSPPGGKK